MRKVFAVILFLFAALACMAARTADAAVPDEEQRDCVMESCSHSQQHHAIIFKSDGSGVTAAARCQSASGVKLPDSSASSETTGRTKPLAPSRASRQTITQQNIVERK